MKKEFSGRPLTTDRRCLLKAGATALGTALLPNTLMAQAVKRGGTLRVSNGGDPPDFDLHQTVTYLTEFVGSPCYSTLLKIDPDNSERLLPDLAEGFEVSADGRTVMFKIRRGVQFHDGSALSAEDVVFSLDRIRNPPAGVVSPRKGLFGNISEIAATDSHTVVIKLQAPQDDFLFLISNPFNVIYPKSVTAPLDQQNQGMKRKIVGTGPFKLTQAIDGQIYELSRFDKFYGQPPHLEKIQFFPIKDEVARAVALQGNRIDACFFFSNDSVMQTLRGVPNVIAIQRPTPTSINLVPNVRVKPFDDLRVREALSLAIDRSSFIKTVGPLAGANFHSKGLMLPGSPFELDAAQIKQFSGYDTLPGLNGDIEANRKKAMQLLEQAGVPKGFKIVLPARNDLAAFRDSSINLAAQLQAVGLDVSVDMKDAAAFFAQENRGDFQLLVHSIGFSGTRPDQILGEGYTSFGGRNYGGWKEDEVDDLFRQQSRERDPNKRADLIRQFQTRFLKTYFHINLAWVGYGAGYTNAMKGWKPISDIYANMQLDNVWLDK